MNRKITEKDRTATPLQPLLSTERSQKLDLLLHLISNISEGLVLCGPFGIGKSTILDLVQAASLDTWTVCRINASSTTHFDDIQATLVESVSGGTKTMLKKSARGNLSDHLDRFKRGDKFLLLLLDDAGEMAPGVLTAVCGYADSNPALRPVFTMTADRLHLVASSDPVVANCQVIEVPPLTEIQCGKFLQNLSGKPGALVSFKAITPSLIQRVYRESHGVPGNVLSILSGLSKGHIFKAPGTSLPIYACITLVVAIGIGYLLWSTTDDSSLTAQSTVLSGARVSGEGTIADLMSPPAKDSVRTTSKPQEGTLIDADEAVTEFFIQSDPLARSGTSPNITLEKETFPGFSDTRGAEDSSSIVTPEESNSQSASDSNQPSGNSASSPAISAADSSHVELAGKIKSQTAGSSEDQPGFQVTPGEQSSNQVDAKTDETMLQLDEKVDLDTGKTAEPSNAKPVDPVVAAAGTAESVKANGIIAGVRDDHWIRKQNPQRFTLQLLAVKKFDAIKKFIHSHSQLEGLAVFRTHKKGANWYALIQGVYPSLSAAKEASQKLPSGLRNAWPRKFKSVQNGMIDFHAE